MNKLHLISILVICLFLNGYKHPILKEQTDLQEATDKYPADKVSDFS